MNFYRLIFDFVRRHRRAYVGSVAMLVGVAALSVWIPRQIGIIVDQLIAHGDQATKAAVWQQIGALLAMAVAIYVLRVGWRLKLFTTAYRLGVELRSQLYQRLLMQGPSFFSRHKTGDLMARATNDVDAIEMAAGEAFLAAFDGMLTLVLVVAMMTLGIDWRLALVALAPFPLMGWAFWVITRRVHNAWQKSLSCFSILNAHTQETISGVRMLYASGLQPHAMRAFGEHAKAASAASFEAQAWESAYEPAVGLTLTFATVSTLALGGWLIWHQLITVGQLTAFTIYLGQLIWPMFAAGWVMSLIERGKAAWHRLRPLVELDHPALEHEEQGSRETTLPAADGVIGFDGVGFSYPNTESLALRDISFEIRPGQTIGIVGPTGCGKTTLLHLMLRFYRPSSGQITWGRQDIQNVPLEVLRQHIAWVPQEPFLFSGTIAENITLAAPQATTEQILDAAKCAALDDDIARFPKGLGTMVGERGVTLSGGQRQRVAIARALLSQASLLLLDDALSAVDTGTQTRILEHLRYSGRSDQGAGRSMVVVSHRLSAIAHAHNILVLKDGQIIQSGAHAALLRAQGWYAAQWRYQQLEAQFDRLPFERRGEH